MCALNTELTNGLNTVSNGFPTRLFLKTVFHSAVCTLCFVVLLRGAFMWFSLTDVQTLRPEVDNIKKFLFCFFTNWNYVSILFFNTFGLITYK